MMRLRYFLSQFRTKFIGQFVAQLKTSGVTNKGFSLLEVMMVVALIGTLGIVAVPNFKRFQGKAQQAEVKASLSSLYMAEKVFFAEFNGYSAQLDSVGFKMNGAIHFNIGFLGSQNGPLPSGVPPGLDTCSSACSGIGTASICTAAVASDSQCVGLNGGLNAFPPGNASLANFVGGGFAYLNPDIPIADVMRWDQWTIDDKGVIKNIVNGL